MLILELVKERDKKTTALESMPPPVIQGTEDDEESQIRIASLKLCLQKLSAENRDMILGYYQEEKGVTIETRRLLAERLQIPLNALRIRALRLRDKLEKCINGRQPRILRGRALGTNL